MRPPHPEFKRQADGVRRKIVGGFIFGESTSTDVDHMLVAAYWAGRIDEKEGLKEFGPTPPNGRWYEKIP